MPPLARLPLVPRLTVILLAVTIPMWIVAYFAMPAEVSGVRWDRLIDFIAMLLLLNVFHLWLARGPRHLRRKAIIVGVILGFSPLIANLALIPLLARWPSVFEPLARLFLAASGQYAVSAAYAVGGALFAGGLLASADRAESAGVATGSARVDHPTPSP